MRSIALVVILVAACADSRFGAYFVVEGDDKLTFDRVEFYFGHYEMGSDVPTSPRNPEPVDGLQFLNTRIYDSHDNWTSSNGSQERSFTYYVPTGGENDDLVRADPSYVMIVAYSKGKPIGIAEQIGFQLSNSEVDKYIVHLLPFLDGDVEIWGFGQPDCIKWRHHRATDPLGTTSVVAVVRDHDRDCDGYLDAEDCNRLVYCDFATHIGCSGSNSCIGMNPCSLGACTQTAPPGSGTTTQSCTPTTCLFDAVCSGSCDDPTKSLDERLQCGFSQSTHTEVYIPVNELQQLCAIPSHFELQVANALCSSPNIIYPRGGKEPDGVFVVAALGSGPDVCGIDVYPPMFGDPAFHDNDDHVVLGLDSSVTAVPTTYVFGVHPNPVGGCSQPLDVQTMGSGAPVCTL